MEVVPWPWGGDPLIRWECEPSTCGWQNRIVPRSLASDRTTRRQRPAARPTPEGYRPATAAPRRGMPRSGLGCGVGHLRRAAGSSALDGSGVGAMSLRRSLRLGLAPRRGGRRRASGPGRLERRPAEFRAVGDGRNRRIAPLPPVPAPLKGERGNGECLGRSKYGHPEPTNADESKLTDESPPLRQLQSASSGGFGWCREPR